MLVLWLMPVVGYGAAATTDAEPLPELDSLSLKELEDRLEAAGHKFEWADITRDLMNLQYARVEQDGKHFLLRSEAQGTCGALFAAAGVALPPTVQQIEAP